jgi:hypothetical protein
VSHFAFVVAAVVSIGFADGRIRGTDSEPPESSQEGRRRIAVTPFGVSEGVPDVLGAVVADVLVSAIDAPDVELVERQRIGRVLDEQAFAVSGLTQPGEAVRLGRIADIRWILIGDLYRVDGMCVASGRLVDAEDGSIHDRARGSVQFRTVDDMPARMAELAATLGLRAAAVDVDDVVPDGRSMVDALVGAVSPDDPHGLSLTIDPGESVIRVGTALNAAITVERPGFLTLLAIDASGRISRLVPNDRVPELVLRPGEPRSLPSDLGFRMVVRPPLGPTRFKAIVSDRPLKIADGVLDPAVFADRLGADRWSSSEIEFLVVSEEGTLPEPPVSNEDRRLGVEGEPVEVDGRDPLPASSGPPHAELNDEDKTVSDLRGPSSAPALEASIIRAYDRHLLGIDDDDVRSTLGWWRRATGCDDASPENLDGTPPLVAVIDADFDPDDPCLESAFGWLSEADREALREDIRRHGEVPLRHGNRVAALVAGDTDCLSSAFAGAIVLPIAITTTARGSDSRVRVGGGAEVLAALERAVDAGSRVINLSLCLRLDPVAAKAFAADPIWDRLEAKGVVVVCAAGNDGGDRDLDPVFPACLERPNILAVTATGPSGDLLATAAVGRRTVHLAAPGGMLLTSDGAAVPVLASGTSYAAALVSGGAAALIAARPDLTASEVVHRLCMVAERASEVDGRVRYGRFRWPR